MTLHETIKGAIPEALRAKDEVRLRTLRSLVTAMNNELIKKRSSSTKDLVLHKPDEFLADDEALAVVKRAANQRKDSIEQFEKGGRPELAAPEKEELAVIEAYLPAQMSEAELETAVRAKAAELGVGSKADANKLIGALMKDLKGRADGTAVKSVIERVLS